MSKTAADTDLIPESFSTLAEVHYEDARAVVEALNFASQRPVSHLAICSAGAEADFTEPYAFRDPGLGIYFPHNNADEDTWFAGARFAIVVPAEVSSLLLGVRCELFGGQTGSVRATVTEGFSGSSVTSSTLAYSDSDNGDEKTTTIDISSLDRGHMTVEVQLRLDSGPTESTGPLAKMRNLRLEEVAPALTNPPDE